MPSPYHMHTTLLAEFADDRDIGSREMQEDYTLCCAVEEQGNYCSEMMCVLCDGMGGHAGGEVASRVAASAFIKVLRGVSPEMPPHEALVYAAQQADVALQRRKLCEAAELSQMGCTLCGVWFRQGRLFYISIGDSLIYLLRDKRLYPINRIHNHREDMRRRAMREGLDWASVSQSESVLRYGTRITSYLSGGGISQADCPAEPIELRSGDSILLASDGILSLTAHEIARALLPPGSGDVRQDVELLLDTVLQKKARHQDNVSVILVRVVSPGLTVEM